MAHVIPLSLVIRVSWPLRRLANTVSRAPARLRLDRRWKL
jgi:hypothetical protein